MTRRAWLAAACVFVAACSASHPRAGSSATTDPSGSTATAARLRATLPSFTRRTTQGVAITFAIKNHDPFIARIRARLLGESKFEVANRRRPIDSGCLPTLAYHVTATYGTAHFEDDYVTDPVAHKVPRGDLRVTYTADQKHELVIVWLRTSDPRVDSIEFASAGLVDHQRVVGHWAALALVVPPVGTIGDERAVTGELSTRARDGAILSRAPIPPPPTSDPCLPPFAPAS